MNGGKCSAFLKNNLTQKLLSLLKLLMLKAYNLMKACLQLFNTLQKYTNTFLKSLHASHHKHDNEHKHLRILIILVALAHCIFPIILKPTPKAIKVKFA